MADQLTLTKHHALGNDFLVVLAPPEPADLPALARALCHRTRGIGADGLIAAFVAEEADARMVLHNADGSRAEMTGNGIRCLAQALVDATWCNEGTIVVRTDVGDRAVEIGPETAPRTRNARVDMGATSVHQLEDGQAVVDTGNPHLVIRTDDPDAVDLIALGTQHADVNVELIRVDDRDNITMRVHERGVGPTDACGTGSCAVAAATNAWGLTNARVTVHNPGGPLLVELDERGDMSTRAWLTGPTTYIGRIEVDACP